MKEYNFHRLTQDSIKDLVLLYEKSFGKKTDLQTIKAKFNTGCFGLDYIGFIAYSEKKEPSGFYGVFPCMAEYDGKQVVVAQSGHTMTHPKHRGKGLFTKLAKVTYELCKEQGVHAVFGFPNVNSYPGFVKKLDWVHFDDYQSFHSPANFFNSTKLERIGISKEKIRERGESMLKKQEKRVAFDNSLSKDFIRILHDQNYFNYKIYAENFVIETESYQVWCKLTNMFLLVGDLSCQTLDEFKFVYKELLKLSKRLLVPHVRFQVSSETKLFSWCKELGLEMGNTYPIAGLKIDPDFELEKMKFTLSDIDTF